MRIYSLLWVLCGLLCAGACVYLVCSGQARSGRGWMIFGLTAAAGAIILACAQLLGARGLKMHDGTVQVFSDERARVIQGGVTYETAPSISVDIQDGEAQVSINKDHGTAVLLVRGGTLSLRGNEYGGVRSGDFVQVTDEQVYVNRVERLPS
ncbi:MAG TPA: hypothetical protein VK689_13905 [Armatimonadota bacterium]|nr:hypothetical protein [Armatimonadota bacterium]